MTRKVSTYVSLPNGEICTPITNDTDQPFSYEEAVEIPPGERLVLTCLSPAEQRLLDLLQTYYKGDTWPGVIQIGLLTLAEMYIKSLSPDTSVESVSELKEALEDLSREVAQKVLYDKIPQEYL